MLIRVAFCVGFLLVGLLIYCLVVWIVTNLAHLIPGPVGEQFRIGDESLLAIYEWLIGGIVIAAVMACILGYWVSFRPQEARLYLISLAVMAGIPLLVMVGFLANMSRWTRYL